MNSVEKLAAAPEYPWDKWTIFLRLAQRELGEREFNGRRALRAPPPRRSLHFTAPFTWRAIIVNRAS
jgi:hypothetical protein